MPAYLTGVDWSGDPGLLSRNGASRWLVLAACHACVDDLPGIEAKLDHIRRSRRLPDNYPFKYSGSRQSIKSAFFSTMADAPIAITVVIVDKGLWSESEMRSIPGIQQIARSVADLIAVCPIAYVSGQRLLIDLPPKEGKYIRRIREEIRGKLKSLGRDPILALKPVPDHRSQGTLIQIADMAAGLIQDECGGRRIQVAEKFRTAVTLNRH